MFVLVSDHKKENEEENEEDKDYDDQAGTSCGTFVQRKIRTKNFRPIRFYVSRQIVTKTS